MQIALLYQLTLSKSKSTESHDQATRLGHVIKGTLNSLYSIEREVTIFVLVDWKQGETLSCIPSHDKAEMLHQLMLGVALLRE